MIPRSGTQLCDKNNMVIIVYKKDALVLKQTLLEEFQSILQKLQLFNVTYDNFFYELNTYIYIYIITQFTYHFSYCIIHIACQMYFKISTKIRGARVEDTDDKKWCSVNNADL